MLKPYALHPNIHNNQLYLPDTKKAPLALFVNEVTWKLDRIKTRLFLVVAATSC